MIGFIGGGNMAEAIISGLRNAKMEKVVVSDISKERLTYLEKRYRIKTVSKNIEIPEYAETIILSVKPQDMDKVTAELRNSITDRHLIISIAAGIRLEYLSENLQTRRIVRVMPNTPALVGAGISVISPMRGLKKKDIKTALEIFRAVGEVIVLDEEKMDVVTALSGSGPAFFAYFIESMSEGGVRLGLSAADALKLSLQTGLGTIKLLNEGRSPAELIQMVTSPGGTTAEGLHSLDKHAFKAAVKDAIEASTKRSRELSRKTG